MTASSGCAPRSSPRMAARWSRTRRGSTAATTRRRRAWPGGCWNARRRRSGACSRRNELGGMRRLAILRPEPGASATVERARELGLDAFAVPLFAIEPLAWELPDSGAFDALLLTSANTVRQAGPSLERLLQLPAYAVGDATAAAAEDA